jgi:hypothetical protein
VQNLIGCEIGQSFALSDIDDAVKNKLSKPKPGIVGE